MAVNVEALNRGEPGLPARPLAVSRQRVARRIRLDRWASRLVVLGGIIVIASILAILFVIAAEVYPLFKAPTATMAGTYPVAGGAGGVTLAPGAAAGVDEYREVGYVVDQAGRVLLTPLKGARRFEPIAVAGLDGATVTGVAAGPAGARLLGTSDGRVVPLGVKFEVAFEGGTRTVTPVPEFGPPSALDPEGQRPILRLAFASPDAGGVVVGQVGPTELVVQTVIERKALIGGTRREEALGTLRVPVEGQVTALAVDGRAEDLFVGTSTGQIVRYDLRNPAEPALAETVALAPDRKAAVTALGFLIGDRTLVVGDAVGGVSSWQVITPPGAADRRLVRMHGFRPHPGAVVAIASSRRDKGFVTADASGVARVHYGTSGKTLLSLETGAPGVGSAVFAPKADGILVADGAGTFTQWTLDNPHPEITLRTVFGRVWYEGYAEPDFVWQSTGGTDDFEAKFSLTPLIYGTLKGTFYALLIAVPLALLAALYVSEFMHPDLKRYAKPVVEVMAALPSVVLGFLAGLWLAPMVERVVPGLFLLPVVLTVFILAALLGWLGLSAGIRGRFRNGTEVFLLIPVIACGVWAALALGGLVEAWLLGGSYRSWLLSALGLTYDQRNSLVVGIAMGFAVIPIIFTIAEDSLANVPQHLRAGSLALGANRWQTAVRIVLPTASPGIFSAVMIGFGRAVGETMIVLMATGNTPVMEWSIFNGFRALSANIAVELPEAPEGGTLFRVLFLAAFLLFCMTFVVNTVAEVVRLKLRRKYRYL